MKPGRLFKMMVVALLTTFLVVLVVLNLKNTTIGELKLFEMLELFVAVPLLTVVYYWLISSKFDEFHERMAETEAHLKKIVKEFEVEEEELTGQEKTLKQEIIELKEVVEELGRKTKKLKKRTRR